MQCHYFELFGVCLNLILIYGLYGSPNSHVLQFQFGVDIDPVRFLYG